MLLRGGVDSDYIKDLEFFNAPQDLIDEARQQEGFGIYPENWEVFQFFLRVQTQWHITGMGQRVGLDYAGVEVVARVLGVEITPAFLDDLQLIELTVIRELNKDGAG